MTALRHRAACVAASAALALLAACGGGGGSGGGGNTPLNITSTTVADGIIDADYSESVVATGGRGTKTFSITAGSLPDGLAMSAAGVISGTPAGPAGSSTFTVSVTDSAKTPATDTQALAIDIIEPVLGRNDTIDDATTLPGNGTYHASISPSGHPNTVFAPDEDFYRITAASASDVTVDINARSIGSPLDSVIEIVGANGLPLNTCVAPTFNAECQHDDDDTDAGELDSFLQVRVSAGATFYIHVVDWGSNARPDKLYDLVISGVN